MKIYWDCILLDEVPERRTGPGEFFPRLVAVNVSSDGKSVEPMYVPLIRIQRRAGQVLIEINSNRPLYYITLQSRKPFVNFFRFDWKTDQDNL